MQHSAAAFAPGPVYVGFIVLQMLSRRGRSLQAAGMCPSSDKSCMVRGHTDKERLHASYVKEPKSLYIMCSHGPAPFSTPGCSTRALKNSRSLSVTYLHHMVFLINLQDGTNVERYKDRISVSVELTGRMCRFVLQLCCSLSMSDTDKHM